MTENPYPQHPDAQPSTPYGDAPGGTGTGDPVYGSAGSASGTTPPTQPLGQAPQTPYGYGEPAQPYAAAGAPGAGYGQPQQPYGYPPQQPYGHPGGYDPNADPNAKSRLAAGLLGILLGSLGIHRFYLGYTGIGVLMLLLSVLSFGFLAPAIGIWGLVEGILYLTAKQGYYSVDSAQRPLRA